MSIAFVHQIEYLPAEGSGSDEPGNSKNVG